MKALQVLLALCYSSDVMPTLWRQRHKRSASINYVADTCSTDKLNTQVVYKIACLMGCLNNVKLLNFLTHSLNTCAWTNYKACINVTVY